MQAFRALQTAVNAVQIENQAIEVALHQTHQRVKKFEKGRSRVMKALKKSGRENKPKKTQREYMPHIALNTQDLDRQFVHPDY